MKKHLLLTTFTLSLLSFHHSSFWVVIDPCSQQSGYELYECRVTNICEQTLWWAGFRFKPEKIIYNTDTRQNKYEELEEKDPNYLNKAKQKYRDNMNNIYKCALIKTQIAALENMKNIEKHPDIAWKIDKKIAARLQTLNTQKRDCWDADNNTPYNKKNVLKNASYEMCKYINYLDYLDTYGSNNIWNIIIEDTTIVWANQKIIIEKQLIQQEIDNTIKIFPLAFTAYSQYENNYSIHLMLELIREDFIIFRNRLQKTLWPISQLIYKAINSSAKQ